MAEIHLSGDGQVSGFASFSMMMALLKLLQQKKIFSEDDWHLFKKDSLYFVHEFFAKKEDVLPDFHIQALAAENRLNDILDELFP